MGASLYNLLSRNARIELDVKLARLQPMRQQNDSPLNGWDICHVRYRCR